MRTLAALTVLLNGCYLGYSFEDTVLACGGCEPGFACVHSAESSQMACEEVDTKYESSDFETRLRLQCRRDDSFFSACDREGSCEATDGLGSGVCGEALVPKWVTVPSDLCWATQNDLTSVGRRIVNREGCHRHACREEERTDLLQQGSETSDAAVVSPSCAGLLSAPDAAATFRRLGAGFAQCRPDGDVFVCGWSECDPREAYASACVRLYLRTDLKCSQTGWCVDETVPSRPDDKVRLSPYAGNECNPHGASNEACGLIYDRSGPTCNDSGWCEENGTPLSPNAAGGQALVEACAAAYSLCDRRGAGSEPYRPKTCASDSDCPNPSRCMSDNTCGIPCDDHNPCMGLQICDHRATDSDNCFGQGCGVCRFPE